MARTEQSIRVQSNNYAQTDRSERRARHFTRDAHIAGGYAALSLVDALTGGRVSELFNRAVENYPIDLPDWLHIPVDGNVTPSRLAAAGVFTVIGAVASIKAGNRRNEALGHWNAARLEELKDRQLTGERLAAGISPEGLVLEPHELSADRGDLPTEEPSEPQLSSLTEPVER